MLSNHSCKVSLDLVSNLFYSTSFIAQSVLSANILSLQEGIEVEKFLFIQEICDRDMSIR